MVKSSHNRVSEQILIKFAELIQVFGIRQITIDMIAEKCGISKKTVYKYFSSKSDMVERIINEIIDKIGSAIDEIDRSDEKPAMKLEHLFGTLYQMLGSLSIPMLHDIRTGYPETNRRVEDFINSHRELIRRNIARGIEEGDFYPDVHPLIAMEIAMAGAEKIINPDYILKNNLTIEQTITSFRNLMIHALIKK